jgi:N-acetylglucosaminyldiphosphoundecaprenol N-acetyl-beta-D-mannosaminyltransferase
LFGMALSRMDYRQTLEWLAAEILAREQQRACVFSANVDQVVRYARDPAFRRAYGAAALVVPDGMPVVWASRLAGVPVPERVSGIDLLYGLCAFCTGAGLRCFLLGAHARECGRAAASLQNNFPGLQISGCHDGYFADDEPVVAMINAAQPDVLFVGMGSPRQEQWLERNFARLRCRLALPVGGALEVIAGARRRAPLFVQKLGMEWAWRLAQEPRRLARRYLVEDLKFFALVLHELRQRRGQWRSARPLS